MRTREEIEAEMKELEDKKRPLDFRLRQCRDELTRLLSPVHVGDIITWGTRNRRGRVISVIPQTFLDGFNYAVIPIRKNGSEGYRSHIVYSYSNIRILDKKS